MHGFIFTVSFENSLPEFQYQWKSLFCFQPTHIKRSFKDLRIYAEQYTSETFLTEKIWINNDDYFFISEGIITNLAELYLEFNTTEKEELLRKLILTDSTFYSKFTGNYAGFFWNKVNNNYCSFNNHAGTRKLFYFNSKDYLIISTDLFTLGRTLDILNIKKSHDLKATGFLLTSGFMHEDLTLINEVKQVRAGEFILKSKNSFEKKFYFNLADIPENEDDEKTIIENTDSLFKQAIRNEFEFEKSFHYNAITTISGGLDSRMVALMSHDLGYRNQTFLNFSEKKYADQIIAAEIAEAYQVPLIQISLSAKSLLAIDENVAVNDGLTIYTGCSHIFSSIRQANLKNVGIIHTGILGDGYMGSYLNNSVPKPAKITDGVFSKGLLNRYLDIFQESISKYRNEELYKFYNRAYSGINTGFIYFNLIGETFSAFTYPDFARYTFSVPTHLKYKKKSYIRWIKEKHPEYARFVWESIGGKPTNSKINKFYYRVKRAIIKRMPWDNMWKNSMNPEQVWYDQNTEIKSYLDNYFESHIHLASFNAQLLNDLKSQYLQGNINEKAQVLTLLAAYKLHFR